MLSSPKEMTVLSQQSSAPVIASGEGHNPIRPWAHPLSSPHICHHTVQDRAQIWTLRDLENHDEVTDYLEKIAKPTKTTVAAVIAANQLTAKELRDTDEVLVCRGRSAHHLPVASGDSRWMCL